MSLVLTNSQLSFLEKLACFRYLTAQQCLDLGISQNLNSVRSNVINKLFKRSRPLIERGSFGQELPGKGGRIPYVHCLTKHGAGIIADYWQVPEDQILFPVGGIQFARDVLHRIATIDCHIQIRDWLNGIGGTVEISDWYFDKTGSQKRGGSLEASTRVYSPELLSRGLHSKWCEPDGIVGLQIGNVSILYVLEVHCFPDTGRITEQLTNHITLLKNGAIAKKYRSENSQLVLSVHEHKSTFESVKARLQGTLGFDEVANDVVFNRLDQIKNDITQGWVYADGRPANPFPR
ncbi:MAG: hypothetical protein AAF292_11075 [Pseudomonadota bacterium]